MRRMVPVLKSPASQFFILWIFLLAPSVGRAQSADLALPKLLPSARQIELREAWLEKRHAALLPMMRRHGVGMC